MKPDSFTIGHAQALLDVVVGVVIAMPLASLPTLIEAWSDSSDQRRTVRRAQVVKALLLASSLLFVTFYWLETRQFVDDQVKFAQAVASGTVIDLPARVLVGGSLLMIVGASCVLAWSSYERFRHFLVANVTFWICDFVGGLILRSNYLRYRTVAAQLSETSREHAWYRNHIVEPFFTYYALANAAVFLLLLFIDLRSGGGPKSRLAIAVLILVTTIVRHAII